MAFKLAFIGYDREQTNTHFEELFVANAKQTSFANLGKGVLILHDGTEIRRIDSLDDCAGYMFDQIIIADDSRMNVLVERRDEIAAIELTMMYSCVPEEFQRIFYNTDLEEE